jgi:hypothetical protein
MTARPGASRPGRCRIQVASSFCDTSWLARRVGLLADPGDSRPTPWVHTDVLVLIARAGLGIAPRDAEIPIGGPLLACAGLRC